MIAIKNEKIRSVLRILIPFLIIPAVAVLGTVAFDGKKHIIISLSVAVLSFLLFVTGFEKKSTGTGRMVIVAIMTALSVAGRFIPFFKPVTALTVITGMYLGGESGFLVGSLSAVISNIYFGQGPWTAFQMLAWGLIGLFAGFLSVPLKKSRIFLLIYGLVSGVFFSMFMDIWTVLWYNGSFDINLYLTSVAAAVPQTVLYAVSNFIFLLVLAKPFGEKLSRVRTKYGI